MDGRNKSGHDEETIWSISSTSRLPPGIRSRYVDNINGLRMHVLEAGFETNGRPCLLLLHGFPELAYSWRKVMPALAAAGYHVIAPDQRGYGRTTGWDADYDGDLASFRLPNLVRDALGLVSAFGYRSRRCRDRARFRQLGRGMVRADPAGRVSLGGDDERAVRGPPALPFNTADAPAKPPSEDPVHRELAALPRPRKHYQWYYSTREANADMHRAPQGVHDFLRAYYHHKSADWKANAPYPLKSWSAGELAKLPTYYIMDLAEGHGRDGREGNAIGRRDRRQHMAARQRTRLLRRRICSAPDSRAACNGIAAAPRARSSPELQTWSGRTIDVPSAFISGKQDWGTYQRPGVFEAMQSEGLHQHDRLPSRRWRRPLGAAGAARRSQPPAAGVLRDAAKAA